jgi:ElaB/YqjD/DUF883 family membrane-anchored ribosome-binding protein
MSDEVRHDLQRGADKAREGIDNIAGIARDKVGSASSAAVGAVSRIEDAGRQAWDISQRYGSQAQDVAGDVAHQVSKKARRGLRMTSAQVRAEPILSIAVAAAIGYVLALMVHGRR